jgi:hypothetical protein
LFPVNSTAPVLLLARSLLRAPQSDRKGTRSCEAQGVCAVVNTVKRLFWGQQSGPIVKHYASVNSMRSLE